jgi:hypothetical protein
MIDWTFKFLHPAARYGRAFIGHCARLREALKPDFPAEPINLFGRVPIHATDKAWPMSSAKACLSAGSGNGFRRQFAKSIAIVPREMARTCKITFECRSRHAHTGIARQQNFSRAPEANCLGKSHRRIASAALESPENGTRTHSRLSCESVDGDRFSPVGFDELLQPPDHPGHRHGFLTFQQMAKLVAARTEKRNLHGLLKLTAYGRRQFGRRRVQLLRKKMDEVGQALRVRLVRLDRGLECHDALWLGTQKRSQSLQQRLPVQAKRKAFMPCLTNRPRGNAERSDRKLARVDVGHHTAGRRGRAALERDLKPDEVGREIIDRQVTAGRAEGQTYLLKLNEIDARLEVFDVFQIDPGRAEQVRSELPQLLGIGSPKDRKTM